MRGTTFAVAVLLYGLQAEAGTITQTVSFHYAEHGTSYGGYNQFDPSLGPLNAVATTINIYGNSEIYGLYNETVNTINFNATVFIDLNTVVGPIFNGEFNVPLTLGPFQSTSVGPMLTIPGPPGDQTFSLQYTNLSPYIGTGILPAGPLTGGPPQNISVDNSSITIQPLEDWHFDGTMTVTYAYGTTLTLPEPGSIVGISFGLAAVAALAWRRRKAA